ncbi:MAG: hypothetical protein K2H85_04920 [Allobaculum sp.]|nr:hypothetical protein [Allobaculum sp.]
MATPKKQLPKTQKRSSNKKTSKVSVSSSAPKSKPKSNPKARSKRSWGRIVLWIVPLILVGILGGVWYYKDQVRQGTMKAGLDFLTTQENGD